MDDTLQKTIDNILKRLKESEEQTKVVIQNQINFVNFVKNFDSLVNIVLNDIRDVGFENQRWSKEFHRLAINEYSKSPHHKVYGLVYVKKHGIEERRLMLVSSNTLEEAYTIGESVLTNEGEDAQQWIVEGFQSIRVPLIARDSIKVDAKLFDANKPIGVFINDLNLMKDVYAANGAEKKTLRNMIGRLEKKYSTSKGRSKTKK